MLAGGSDFVVVGYGEDAGTWNVRVVDYVVVAGLSAMAFLRFSLWATVAFLVSYPMGPTAVLVPVGPKSLSQAEGLRYGC